VIIVRYADDSVKEFQQRRDAERFLTDLRSRMQKFGFALHPEKTRLIEFGRFAIKNRKSRGGAQARVVQLLGLYS
jgi:RNA-directed DNA polymerase